MPVKIIVGNIFDSECQTIVNAVNCVGVMGKGLALEFKQRYPEMYNEYKSKCQSKTIDIGKLHLYKNNQYDKWILNFPTKTHWKYPSKIEYIKSGLDCFIKNYTDWEITSIAFPLLGTGNGQLEKNNVLELMVPSLNTLDIRVEIYDR